MTPVRIHLADDHTMFREGLAAIFASEDGLEIVGQSPTGEEGAEPVGGLSERETEVLVLAARGLSNRLIAKELHISEATAKRHLANIYQKVGVRSRNEAVRKALTEEWFGLEEIIGDGEVGR